MNRLLAIVAGIVALTAVGCLARLPKGNGDSLLAVIEEGDDQARNDKGPARSPEEIERAQVALEEIPTRPHAEALADARRAALEKSHESDHQLLYLGEDDEQDSAPDNGFDLTSPPSGQKAPVRFAGHSSGQKKPRPKRTPASEENEFENEPDLKELMARAIERGNAAIRMDCASGSGRPKLVREVSWSADAEPVTPPVASAPRESRSSKRKQSSSSSRKADVAKAFGEDDPPPPVTASSKNKLRKDETAKKTELNKTEQKTSKKPDAVEMGKPAASWPAAHRDAIAALKEKISQARRDGEDRNEIARLETMLRLQYLLAGDRDEATKPIDDLPSAEQEYWKHQMFELADMLSDKHAGDTRRYSLALHALDEATARLAELSSLSLRSTAFCKSVRDFGSIERFERLDFARNQEVLLYVEVRNFASQKISDSTFETELQGSYRVLDRSGAPKAERVLPLDKQTCANRRRDYYIAYRLFIPAELEPGAYTLELTIEDKKAGKSTNARVDFNVVSSPTE